MEKWQNSQNEGESNRQTEVQQSMALYEQLLVNDPEGAAMLLDSYRREAVADFDKIRGSFAALYDRLNLFNQHDLKLFDFPVESDTTDEKYLRFWVDNNGQYNATELTRRDSKIIDYGNAVDSSGKFRYVFEHDGQKMAADMDILDDSIPGDTSVVGDDGNLRAERTVFESGVIIATYEHEVLPSLKVARNMLSRLWQVVHDNEQ